MCPLKNLSLKFQKEILNIESKCFEIVGSEFNLGSPKQIGEILFDKLKIKGGKKTPSGAWSTDAETLISWQLQGIFFLNFFLNGGVYRN